MTSHYLEIAIEAVKEAGKFLQKIFYKRFEVNYKPDGSIITEADLKADSLIRSLIESNFPEHSILSEESVKKSTSSDYLWIIDPLDGSSNFYARNPFFAVSIGLLYKHQPILGVIYSPFQKELFFAEDNGKAYLNNKVISVDEKANFESSFLTFCNGRDLQSRKNIIQLFSKIKAKNNRFRQIGAAALELCYVATGRFGASIMLGINAWDIIAGALIVKEANGKVTDFNNNLFTTTSSNLIAGSSSIHNSLLSLIVKTLSNY